jgi:hypothetical protein
MKMRRGSCVFTPLLLALLASCAPPSSSPGAQRVLESSKISSPAPVAGLDSFVLDRLDCGQGCSFHRISVSATGLVRASGTTIDSRQVSVDTVRALWEELERMGFESLPEDISADSTLCGDRLMHGSNRIFLLFRPSKTKRVELYSGCIGQRSRVPHPLPPKLRSLRDLEYRLDSIGVRAFARR